MSIRKREWTTPKGEQKSAWVVDYVDLHGKRRLKTFDRKKEAVDFEATAKVEVREGTHVADSATVTVYEAGKLWIAAVKRSDLERSSVEDYERTLRLHIAPFLGSAKLTALNTVRLRAYEDELRNADRSAFMIKRTLTTLGTMLADAQERGLVVRNAAREMQAKRGKGASRSEKRQKGRLKVGIDIPAREEITALLGSISGRWRPLIMTAIFTGLRASELRGLRWEDVDFEKKTLRVHQRADRYDDIGKPKSISGERTIPVPPLVINTLKEWKLACPRRDTGKKDADGNPVTVLELVFPNGAGNVEGLRNILRRGLHPAWIAAGVSIDSGDKDENGESVFEAKYTGMHCLRHWYASWCINRKADGGLELPPKLVQERMGHSTIAMTMDTYGHLFPRDDDGKELAAAADSIYSGGI
ncbi:tyrosine-type recombinase/integrase [Brucella pseudogrignonensis]|uniref:tyrosine-type recombinase/integrase n=1 Tax=Brucella pseudogrignonensis TaxID=419475 RepID=UPI0028BA3751|nr:tyrosine-type recombinase/integrase [Brucella pseudogrignonensis]MDT6940704.1 tyrosine-type recombinase/integrase [Brucella pseudogrignonensis]